MNSRDHNIVKRIQVRKILRELDLEHKYAFTFMKAKIITV